MIEAHAIGSTVLLDGVVQARVTAIVIREGSVAYECVWWNERERKVEVVEAWEVRPDGEGQQSLSINQIL